MLDRRKGHHGGMGTFHGVNRCIAIVAGIPSIYLLDTHDVHYIFKICT